MYHFELCFSLDMCPRMGLLDDMAAVFFVCQSNSILLRTVAIPIYIPTNRVGGFFIPFLSYLFFIPSPALIACILFDDSHSNCCEVIPHCSFYLHFPDD